MKHRNAAPPGVPEPGPVTFIDVVSCFSEEEWKLLHHWQKELYRNVMKDIHQALLSLGPMIANSVFSLKHKEYEELGDMDIEDLKLNHDLNTFQGYSTSESNTVFRKTRSAKQHLKNSPDSNERGSCDKPNTGPPIASSVYSMKPKGHEELCDMDIEDTNANCDSNTSRGDSPGDSNAAFRKTRIANEHLKDNPVTNEKGSCDMPSTDTMPIDSVSLKEECDVETLDYSQPQGTKRPTETTRLEVTRSAASGSVADNEESYAIETQDYGGGEGVSSSVEPGMPMPYVPMGINEDGETYPIDIQDYGKSEGNSSYLGHEAAGAEKKLPYKVSSEKVNMFPTSEKVPGSRRYVWPGRDWSDRAVKSETCESDFDDNTHSSSDHWTTKEMLSGGHSERDGGLLNVQIFEGQSKLEDTSERYTVAGSDDDLKQHIRIIDPHKRKIGVSHKPNFHCKVCGKGFRQKGSLICHERVHSGEKPYHCSVCDKRFTQKHRLVGHERTHSGERPFLCEICLKRFTWKDGLLKHYRTHTGERPYQCTKCMKCFSQKEGVIRHLKTHTVQKQQFTPLNFPL
ncbi:uncharacterized protein LOC144770909 isoform X1 [Lissotriton helveticus]